MKRERERNVEHVERDVKRDRHVERDRHEDADLYPLYFLIDLLFLRINKSRDNFLEVMGLLFLN